MLDIRNFKCIALLLLHIVGLLTQSESCLHGDIRLEDGPTKFEGRVEVCMDGEWNTVCNDFWGHNEGLVVCGQLGYAASGLETFVDLRITGGPNIGIDNINCTGAEERLIDCDFSDAVRDCDGEEHKVGLRCHEERLPRNSMLEIGERMLKLEWEEPEEGVTNEVVQSYTVECSIIREENKLYSVKQTVGNDALMTSLPKIVLRSGDTNYNCCVEATFQTYSSRVCDFPSITVDEPHSTDQNLLPTDAPATIGSRRSCNSQVQLVAGVLGSFIVILVILLLIAVVALVHACGKLVSNKKKSFLSMASVESSDERVLDNPTYGEGEPFSSRTNVIPEKTSSSSQYVSNGPTYESVYSSEQNPNSNACDTTPTHGQPALYDEPSNERTMIR